MAAQHFINALPKATGDPGGNDVVATETIVVGLADTIAGSVFSDRAGTVFIEQSGDGTHWDISAAYPVTANNGAGFKESIILAYARVRFQNTSGSDATQFRLYVRTTSAGAR